MNHYMIGDSVQGASHKRTKLPCQDRLKYVEYDENTLILAVADGHGSSSCPYSRTGAGTAVNVFCSVLQQLIDSYVDHMDMLMTYLNREGDTKVAQSIDLEWKRRIYNVHTMKKRDIPVLDNGEKNKTAVYRQYGTTLLGMLITKNFVFAFQLGDGDIAFVDDEGVDLVIEPEKILGTETHSLSKEDAWKKTITVVRSFDADVTRPSLFSLSTDGFANSHKTEAEFHITLTDYYAMIKEHGADVINANIGSWLDETSELGCGDDTTVLMAYFPQVNNQSEESEANSNE